MSSFGSAVQPANLTPTSHLEVTSILFEFGPKLPEPDPLRLAFIPRGALL
jgi:hypothetical protein